MGLIYRMEFSDGRSYIGITTKPLKKRWGQHRGAVKNGAAPVYAAWRKLGQPVLTVLMELPDDELKVAEASIIVLFNSKFPNGYNATDGGDGGAGLVVSDETRKKMAAAKRGKKMSDSNREKILAAVVGRVKSDDERAKLSRARKGMKLDPDWCKNIGLGKTGVKRSPEAIQKSVAKIIGRKNSPETLVRMSAAAKARELRKREQAAA